MVSTEVLGIAEVCEMLGMSRQRLHVLRSEGRFPPAAIELSGGPIWTRQQVDEFLDQWEPGRGPRRAS